MITPAHVAIALGRPTPSDQALLQQWQLWIDSASMLIEARLGDLASLDQTRLDYVVRESVAAMVRRPDDVTQVDISVDDGSVSRRYQTGTGRVTILDEWWDLLGRPQVGAFSTRPGFVP